jgi:hypothetical protein
MSRRRHSRPGPLDYDLAGALRTVRLAFGDDQVTVLSLVPHTVTEAAQVDQDQVAQQVLPFVRAVLKED